jgi:hypothetical protein
MQCKCMLYRAALGGKHRTVMLLVLKNTFLKNLIWIIQIETAPALECHRPRLVQSGRMHSGIEPPDTGLSFLLGSCDDRFLKYMN